MKLDVTKQQKNKLVWMCRMILKFCQLIFYTDNKNKDKH